MPDISFHWRRGIPLGDPASAKGQVKGLYGGVGESRHKVQTGLSGPAPPLRGCVTWSESLHLSEPLFLHTQN